MHCWNRCASTGQRRKEGWPETCARPGRRDHRALSGRQARASSDYRARKVQREDVLAGLVRVLVTADLPDLLGRLIAHTLTEPKKYTLPVYVAAVLTVLGPWLEEKRQEAQPDPGAVARRLHRRAGSAHGPRAAAARRRRPRR